MTDGQKKILYVCLIGVVLLFIWQIVDARYAKQVEGWHEDFRDLYSDHIMEVDAFCQAVKASGITVQCPGTGAGKTPPPPPDYP